MRRRGLARAMTDNRRAFATGFGQKKARLEGRAEKTTKGGWRMPCKQDT
jgi:hypothetical protein